MNTVNYRLLSLSLFNNKSEVHWLHSKQLGTTAASGFGILAHEWNYTCFEPWSLFISVAGRKSIMLGAFSVFLFPPFPTLGFPL